MNSPLEGVSNGWSDLGGENTSSDAHTWETDTGARMARKGPSRGVKFAYSTHGLMEIRSKLPIDLVVSGADGFAERGESARLISKSAGSRRQAIDASIDYDGSEFVEAGRRAGVAPLLAPNVHAGCLSSAIDRRAAPPFQNQ
jgi:hypothetical protein